MINDDDAMIESLMRSTDAMLDAARNRNAQYADLPDIRDIMRDMPKSDRSIKRSHNHSVRHRAHH